jgi:hypothetical protein
MAIITRGIHAYDELNPERGVPGFVIDENDPLYEAEVLKRDVLPTMFAMVVEEGVRGVWRIQNAILERLGILATDEFARFPIEVCIQTGKRNGLLKPSALLSVTSNTLLSSAETHAGSKGQERPRRTSAWRP